MSVCDPLPLGSCKDWSNLLNGRCMAISLNFGTFILNPYFMTLLFGLYTYWYRESKTDIN